MSSFNEISEIIDEINLLEAEQNDGDQFALANDFDSNNFDGTVVYGFTASGSVIFSYNEKPPVGIPFTKISKEEAVNLIQMVSVENLLEAEEFSENSAEIVEISPWQLDIIEMVSKGEQPSRGEDTDWLVTHGILKLSAGGNLELTPFTLAWLNN